MTENIKVEFIKTHPQAKLPTYANPLDVGADLYTVEEVVISAHQHQHMIISTGLKLAYMDPNYELQVRSKSGLAAKYNLFVSNSPGTIDPGYRGEIKVIITSPPVDLGGLGMHINIPPLPIGSKIAQLVIAPRYRADFGFTEESTESERGEGGFGSTGL